MQRVEIIKTDKISLLAKSIFEGNPNVYEGYSKYDSDIVEINDSTEFEEYIETESSDGENYIHLAIHYPETKGFIEKQKINLIPEKCDGASHRYRINGWGLIHFQLDLKEPEAVECRFAVNSEKRANGWSSTYPELKSPSLWEWKLVEKNARRLIRVLRKCA